MGKTIKGYFQLIRPANALICGASTFAGGILSGRPFTILSDMFSKLLNGEASTLFIRLMAASISASLILAAGNAFNDVRDVKTDQNNAKHRPIPSKLVSPAGATLFSVILAVLGFAISTILGPTGMKIAGLAIVLLFLYDMFLKSVPILGNAIVAFLGALAFLYGGFAGDCIQRAQLLALFAFLLHFGRELQKDAEDFAGDYDVKINTVATVWGVHFTCNLAAIPLLILAVVVMVPYYSGAFGAIYTGIIGIGVWPMLFYATFVPLGSYSESELRRTTALLKAIMPIGLIAVLLGYQGY